MALTPFVRAPQGVTVPVLRGTAAQERLTSGLAITVYNVPTPSMRASQGSMISVFKSQLSIDVSQQSTVVVYRGVVDNPKLRSWTFSLDTHDFYVLKLGTGRKTLVFDLTTKQWSYWASADVPRWRATVGLNWRSAGTIPTNFGTNVVVGDDSTGVLWVLDPMQGYDDGPVTPGVYPFERIATGQMTAEGRQATPVFNTYLNADLGNPGLTLNTVQLDYSDDQGKTYITADEPQVAVSGDYNQEFVWRSLGQVRNPGRLFRIKDNGAFARIDRLDVNV